MIFVFPFAVDRRIHSRPVGTYILLLLNIALYVLNTAIDPRNFLGGAQEAFAYSSDMSKPWQALTYMFFHTGALPLFLNLVFLYLIGVAVEDRIGTIRLFFVYIIGGVFSAVFYTAFGHYFGGELYSMMGASSAIAALTGVFVVLMPWVDFKLLYFYWIYFRWAGSGTFRLTALLFIIPYLALSSWFSGAPLLTLIAGLLFGILAGGAKFGFRAIFMSENDAFRHERELKRNLEKSFKEDAKQDKEYVQPGQKPSGPPNRVVLAHLVGQRDGPRALQEYRRMLHEDLRASLDPDVQVALGDLLVKVGAEDVAFAAFENLLNAHPEAVECARARKAIERLSKSSAAPPPSWPAAAPKAAEPSPETKARSFVDRFAEPGAEPPPVPAPPPVTPVAAARPASFDLMPPGAVYDSLQNRQGPGAASEVPQAAREVASDLAQGALRHVVTFTVLQASQRPSVEPSLDEASYSLILAPGPSVDFAALLHALSEHLRQPHEALVGRLRSLVGFLLTDVSYEKGAVLRERLDRAGVETLLVENSERWRLPESVKAVGLRSEAGRWFWRTDEGDEAEMDPDAVALVATGRVRLIPGGNVAPRAIDLVQFQPRLRIRIWEDSFSEEDMARFVGVLGAGDSLARAFTERLVRSASRAIRSCSVARQVEATGDEATPPRLFKAALAYDYYIRWHLLARLAPDTE